MSEDIKPARGRRAIDRELETTKEKEEPPLKRSKDSCLSKIKKSLTDFFEKTKGCKVALFTHL